MLEALAAFVFVASLLLYGAASAFYYLDVIRLKVHARGDSGLVPHDEGPRAQYAPFLLGAAASGHFAYVALAGLVAHVCPVRSVHFIVSIAAILATMAYLSLRVRFRIGALGLVLSPLGLALLLGTYFLGRNVPVSHVSPLFLALHVLTNLVGVALFLLAGGTAALYLVQERRIKHKRKALSNLPPLDALDRAEHRFLVGGFPFLTLGIVTGTYWAPKLETGSPEEVMRTVFGFATWLLIGGVLLLRVSAGFRGRRAAYGTLLGLGCATLVLLIYWMRPLLGGARHADVANTSAEAERS